MSEHPSNRQELHLEELFTYQQPTRGKNLVYADLRSRAKDLAQAIVLHCPPCADRSAAIRKVREAVMTANAAIALQPPEGDG